MCPSQERLLHPGSSQDSGVATGAQTWAPWLGQVLGDCLRALFHRILLETHKGVLTACKRLWVAMLEQVLSSCSLFPCLTLCF